MAKKRKMKRHLKSKKSVSVRHSKKTHHGGRKASRKSKASKVRKLMRLAKSTKKRKKRR